MTETTLPKTITTEELMNLDYRYSYSDKELHDDWQRLCKITEYKSGAQFKPGMKLCQHFCDNFWSIQNNKGHSFEKAWKDPKTMNTVREWGLKGMSQLWMSWIRRAVFMTSGLPNSSFYRPHFSRQLIHMHGNTHGVLFDPCIGWGGRMLGTLSTGWDYIGCDPNKTTFDNVNKILAFIDRNAELHNIPAETFTYDRKVDIVLTSPPYFNLEVYSDDVNQSYNKFDSFTNWNDNWFVPLMKNSITMLKEDGISAWNVMDSGKTSMVDSVMKTHEDLGFKLVTTLGFNSPLNNIRKLKRKDVTYVFRK